MTLRQIEYALAVAKFGSFTRAAEALFVSQPSLSQQIRSLEAEIGALLFDRPPRPVKPTEVGEVFLHGAATALESSRGALDAARRAAKTLPETFTVATVRSLAVSMLPSCLETLHGVISGVSVDLKEFPHRRDVETAVREGRADLGIGPTPTAWGDACVPVGWDQLVVVFPAGDVALGSGEPVPLASLSDRRLVLFERDHGLGENVERACARAGFEPSPAVRTSQVEAAVRMAASGLGPALVPAKNAPGDLVSQTRRLDPPVIWELAAFADRAEFDPIGAALVDVVKEAAWPPEWPENARVLDLS